MKTVRLLFFAVTLLSTVLLLAACFNMNMYPGATSATTTAPVTTEPVTTTPATTDEVTTAPVTTAEVTTAPTTTAEVTTAPTTTAPVTTAEVTTAPTTTAPTPISQNPIKEVEIMSDGNIRLVYENGKKQFLGTADLREGYNPVSTTVVSLDEGILTLRLSDSASKNIAQQFLENVPADRTFRLREMGGSLEWADALSDNWQVLCPYKLSSKDKAVLVQLCEATGFGKTPAVTGDGVTVVIDGNIFGVRAHNWVKEGYDLINTAQIRAVEANRNFLLGKIFQVPSSLPVESTSQPEASYIWKYMDDEIPPISEMYNTAIGARHGYNIVSAVPNTFGLTLADIGSVFIRRSDNQHYMLVKIPGYDKTAGGGTAWFCPFDTSAMASGNFGKYGYGNNGKLMAGDVIVRQNDKEALEMQSTASIAQFCVATNHTEQHAYLNGTVEIDLAKDGIYEGEYVDFYERYDVIYLPAMLNYLAANVGRNTNDSQHSEEIGEAYFSFITTHRFHKNGSYTVYQTVEFHKYLGKLKFLGVMSMSPSGSSQYIYAPGSQNLGTPTRQAYGNLVEVIGSATLRSYYQFTDAVGTKGMNVGFYPYFGIATDENRATALGGKADNVTLGNSSAALKMYPYLLSNYEAKANTTISFIGYHVPTAKIDDDFFAVNWYFVGDEIYLTMHTDHAVAEKTVALPNSEYLVGLTVTVDEASDGFTVHSSTITAEGITVSTTGAGYVTVKLTKADS